MAAALEEQQDAGSRKKWRQDRILGKSGTELKPEKNERLSTHLSEVQASENWEILVNGNLPYLHYEHVREESLDTY